MDSCHKCGENDPKQLVYEGEEIICKDCRTKRYVKENDNIERDDDNKGNIPFYRTFIPCIILGCVYYRDFLINALGGS